jgi:hypothetical protein
MSADMESRARYALENATAPGAWRALAWKGWLETRARFFTALLAVVLICAFMALVHPFVIAQWRGELVQHPEWRHPDWFGRALRDYPFFLWHFLYADLLQKAMVVAAVLLGVGGLRREQAHGTAGFTLSLPVPRGRLLLARAAVGAAEVSALALAAGITLVVCSRVIGLGYPLLHAARHLALLTLGGWGWLALSLWISASLEGEQSPALVGLSVVGAAYFLLAPWADGPGAPLWVRALDFPRLMAGGGEAPGPVSPLGLGICVLVTAALVAGALRPTVCRDY